MTRNTLIGRIVPKAITYYNICPFKNITHIISVKQHTHPAIRSTLKEKIYGLAKIALLY